MTYTTPELALPEPASLDQESPAAGAQLDDAHVGHIQGALGTIDQGDTAPHG
jgi:hypothetical protein